jgi:hypothetical protein
MRVLAAVLGCLVVGAAAIAGQIAEEYVIGVQISAGSPTSSPMQVVASPVLKLGAGRRGLLRLGDVGGDGLSLSLTPSDLGGGKVALRVDVSNRRSGQTSTSTFDLLTGLETSSPTVALRDATGTFITDSQGRPLFLKVETTTRPR